MLLSLLAAQARDGERAGVISRLASRATGAVTDIVDPDVVLERVDIDALLGRVDFDVILQRIDLDALLAEVDLDGLLEGVDPNRLLARVDPDALLDRVDPDRLLDRVDPNALLDRVDPDRLLERLDPNALLDRVDPDRLLDRVDVDRFMDRVDVQRLMERAGIPEIVRESTGHVAGSVLDVGRRQMVGLDELVGRVAYRVTGRDPDDRPISPVGLVVDQAVDKRGRGQVTGHYAGPLSRLGAYFIDVGVVLGIYTILAAGITFVARFLFGVESVDPVDTGILAGLLLVGWAFLYVWVGTALTGRTVGKHVLGLKVVDRSGTPLRGRQALGRALLYPVSFALLGLGLVGIVVSSERRSLHDTGAGTVVVYDWGTRTADMPAPLTAWLARHDRSPNDFA